MKTNKRNQWQRKIYNLNNVLSYLRQKRYFILLVLLICIGTATGKAQSYSSPYNIDLMFQAGAILQARIDANRDKINNKVDEVFETIDDVEITLDGFTEAQANKVNEFYNALSKVRLNYADNNEVRSVILWLNKWKRYFKSWTR